MNKMTPKQKESYFRLSYDYWMEWKTRPDEEKSPLESPISKWPEKKNIKEMKNTIEELSTLLSHFRKVSEGVYRFFCIFCKGDIDNSRHSKGYLYRMGDYYNYNCYRCNYRSSLRSVLKKLKPDLFLKREMEIESENIN